MSKRKAPADNLNSQFCDMLHDLAEYEKNVARNMFKSKAYRKASTILSQHPVRITSGNEAKKLPGIGAAIAKKIDEIITTGKLEKLEKIKADDSTTAIQLLTQVSGIGPAAAKKFLDQGVNTLEYLKSNERLLNHHQKLGLKYFSEFEERIPREEMSKHKTQIKMLVEELDKQYTATICGSFRRGAVSSGDIDVLITHPLYTSNCKEKKKKTTKLKDIVDHLEEKLYITDTLSHGESKFMGVSKLADVSSHRRLDIRLIPFDQYYCGLLYFTGSDVFNQNMRSLAVEKGFTLNEYSIRMLGTTGVPGEPLEVTCEKDVFDIIGKNYVEPSDRNL